MATPLPVRDANGMQLPVQYDAQGKPYYVLDNGGKQYLSPGMARSYSVSDPTLASNPNIQRLASDQTPAGGEGFGGSNEWDPSTGTWQHKGNWLLKATTLGAGGIIAAPFIAGALGAGGAAGAGTPTISGATGSTLASTATPGMSLLPDVGASGLGGSAGGGGFLGTVKNFLGGGSNGGGYLNTVGKIAGGLSAMQSGRAAGRVAEAGINQNQDRNQIAATQVNLGAGAKRASQAVKGDILANAQNFSYGAPTMVGNIPVPTSSGGLRPSIFSDTTRQLGGQLSSDALNAETSDHGNPVQLTPLPQSGAGDSILNTVATIGQLGSLGSRIPSTLPRKPYDPNNPNGGY